MNDAEILCNNKYGDTNNIYFEYWQDVKKKLLIESFSHWIMLLYHMNIIFELTVLNNSNFVNSVREMGQLWITVID